MGHRQTITRIRPDATRFDFRFWLKQWPDFGALARDLDVSYFTVASWHRRNSIPESWWYPIMEAALVRGLYDITYARLREAAAALRARKGQDVPPSVIDPTTTPPIAPPSLSSRTGLGNSELVVQVAQQRSKKNATVSCSTTQRGNKPNATHPKRQQRPK